VDRFRDIAPFLISDALALLSSWYVFYFLRFEWGWLDKGMHVTPPDLLAPAVIVTLFWMLIHAIFGLYRNVYLISRFDEVIRVMKVTTIGVLILFFLLFIDSLGWDRDNLDYAKYVTLMYWGVVFVLVTTGRMIVLTLQIYLVKQGRGVHKALIVGVGNMATFIHQNLMRHKLSGMNVIGFISDVDEPPTSVNGVPVIGTVADINRIIREKDVKDVIVAIDETQQDVLIAVLDAIEVPDVSVKIVPNFYQLISGMNQTNQIHGLPLIEVMPDPMPTWEKFTKRTLDVVASLLILLILAPVMLIVAILVKLTSKGPIIFAQNRVGLHGKEFMIYKFRTMVQDAEKVTGPVFAQKQDPRITPLGLILRKLRLDELPQLMNVLSGDMSLVGPRPERPYFVDQFKKEIPLYSRRLRVKPGITGWAQVKWKYDESFEDVVEKTKYDLFYVENISLRMDLKILLNTIVTVITGKGQ
jgi:exopolysaccharide biosynthesis polyprenyl glycosylphosphotransferase